MTTAETARAILKTRFGFDEFLPLQSEIIDTVLAGQDSLVLMPTGGGKSLCYQLPALMLGGTTLVISPLIALMKDQVDALNESGIPAGYINSTLTEEEAWQVTSAARNGELALLYAAPERLARDGFRNFLRQIGITLIAVDEAHCISEWGHDFRPDYRNLRWLRDEFASTPVIALTATATGRVRNDIISQLGLQNGRVFVSSFNRGNLTYTVRPKSEAWGATLSLFEARSGQSAIIYCATQQETENLAAGLSDRGINARAYHAGLDPATRRRTQEDFQRDRISVVVATIAFGMGIDKPDVRLVIHDSMPKSVEGYYQETGRAGRDGLPADCVLFYAYADKAKQDYFINQMNDAAEQRIAREQLSRMVDYAQLADCRRRYLLRYFGEELPEQNCGACDVCLNPREEFDATEISQKILSAVIRTGERFGAAHIIQVLRGGRGKRVRELGHDTLSVHGIAREYGVEQLREIIGHIMSRGLLRTEGEAFPILTVTEAGRGLLRTRSPVSLPRPIDTNTPQPRPQTSRSGGSAAPDIPFDADLFEELRALRRRLADERDVPAFVIFSDASLKQMAARFPRTPADFGRISGVGTTKMEQYGDAFVAVIQRYTEAHSESA